MKEMRFSSKLRSSNMVSKAREEQNNHRFSSSNCQTIEPDKVMSV